MRNYMPDFKSKNTQNSDLLVLQSSVVSPTSLPLRTLDSKPNELKYSSVFVLIPLRGFRMCTNAVFQTVAQIPVGISMLELLHAARTCVACKDQF